MLSLARNRSGSVLAVVALSLVVLLGSVGLALDLGRGYLTRARIARAVDAAALAGARVLRSGQQAARVEAEAVARANGVANGVDEVATQVSFGTNGRGENTVMVQATRELPTSFMRALRIYSMDVGAVAEAAVAPLDVVLVLDTSGSLATAGVWGQLQASARSFVGHFDDGIDRMGLVSFQLVAAERVGLRSDFTFRMNQAINALQSAGDTNIQEGLRLAHEQVTSPHARPSAAKAVVFFTDGRATAFRASNVGTPPYGQDRVIAVYTSGNQVRGFWNNPARIPPHAAANNPHGCPNVLVCGGMNSDQVRTRAAAAGLEQARRIRGEGALVYSIGLGDPGAADPILTPDLDYLRRIANEDGIDDGQHPRGRMYFAPSANELQSVFDQVARDLVVRLAR